MILSKETTVKTTGYKKLHRLISGIGASNGEKNAFWLVSRNKIWQQIRHLFFFKNQMRFTLFQNCTKWQWLFI